MASGPSSSGVFFVDSPSYTLAANTTSDAAVTSDNVVSTSFIAIVAQSPTAAVVNQTPFGPTPPPSVVSSNISSSSLTALVSPTDRLAWTSLREQLPSGSVPALPTPVIFFVSGTSDTAQAPVAHYEPVMMLMPGSGEADSPGSPFATTAPALKDGLRRAIPPAFESGEKDLPTPEELARGAAATPQADSPAVYHRPLEQVADRSELFALGTTVPYLLPQQGSVAQPTALRGNLGLPVTAATEQPPVPPEPSPSAESLSFREIRYWLLPLAACILQGLRISPMEPPRPPRLRRLRSTSGQE
jgi:hypothetical protein